MFWVVPQLMEAWDNDHMDIDRLLNKIIYGVLHHPAQRSMGPDGAEEGRSLIFGSVQEWWEDMDDGQRDEYRQKLTRDGVQRGENHREGQHDCGHGCGGKLKMHKNFKNGAPETLEDRIAGAAANAIMGGVKESLSNVTQSSGGGGRENSDFGGFISRVAGGILGGGFKKDETEAYRAGGRTEDGGYSETTAEYGQSGGRYGQAEYTETQYGGGGGGQSEYRRYEQQDGGGSQEYTERTTYGGDSGGYGREQETTSYNRREESYGGGDREEHGRREEESSGGYGRRNEGEEEESGGGFLGNLARRAGQAFEERRKQDGEERRSGWGF